MMLVPAPILSYPRNSQAEELLKMMRYPFAALIIACFVDVHDAVADKLNNKKRTGNVCKETNSGSACKTYNSRTHWNSNWPQRELSHLGSRNTPWAKCCEGGSS